MKLSLDDIEFICEALELRIEDLEDKKFPADRIRELFDMFQNECEKRRKERIE